MAEYETIRVARDGAVATVTVDRPTVLNALNRRAVAELDAAFAALGADETVAGVILTGAGAKAFVAGADIGEVQVLDAASGRAFAQAGQAVFSRIEGLGKPVVAAINGFALGGGCELALACTLRVAAETACLGQPEVKLGLIPGYGGTQRLARLVGPGRALDLLLTGRMVTAAEALAMGLVHRVVPADQLLAETRRLLDEVLQQSPLAVRLCIEAVTRGTGLTLADGLALEADLFAFACGSEDKREGTAAFLAKRLPVFTGR
ncbi:MAG TPA: enoyl-CoA hydratase-related protein [Acidobacteriota bacterium]|nr:enoyl-CoA hydratase-related protein [Acidobacteriota bacterium]HQF88453.1 enoyl-CoA hydratase-related protein [Acidobacteriota bacterium]HQG92864.1 enoyl-CoA hydratase-related protein [Acidobacteriota bacterium]HQK87855.1 enoyl-CoA hydratase-related protein [Acidobacteriota bacterium]